MVVFYDGFQREEMTKTQVYVCIFSPLGKVTIFFAVFVDDLGVNIDRVVKYLVGKEVQEDIYQEMCVLLTSM